MSVKLGLLALLSEGASYGARLRSEFEARTGGTWPLNVGQVYTTLERLVRDGLVAQEGEPDAEGRIAYRLTDDGRAELGRWWGTPVDRSTVPRDELTIKLALAVTVPGVDVHEVVQRQRTATLTHLRDLTRLKRDALDRAEGAGERVEDVGLAAGDDESDRGLAWLLVLENLVFAVEAEVRWLDHVESVLVRHAHRARTGRTRPASPAPDTHDRGDRTARPVGATPAHQEGNPS